MISEQDVIDAYRILLDRQPESEQVIREKIAYHSSVRSLVGDIVRGDEFKTKHNVDAEAESFIVIADTRDGLICIDLSDKFVSMPVLRGTYEPEITAIIKNNLRRGDCFIDIGANIGYYTTIACGIVSENGCVIAIEAIPQKCQMIRLSSRLNLHMAGGNWCSPMVINKILSNKDGDKMKIIYAKNGTNGGGGYIISEHVETPADHHSDMVETVTMNTILAGYDPRIMKMDIEGAEMLALGGGIDVLKNLQKGSLLIVELYAEQLQKISGFEPREAIAFLEGFGLEAHIISRSGEISRVSESDQLPSYGNYLFVK